MRGERRHESGTQCAAAGSHLRDRQRRVPGSVHRHPSTVKTADEDGLDRLHQTADTCDEVAERRAERGFHDDVLGHAAAHCEHCGARLARCTDVAVAVAHPRQDRELGEGLGVRQESRPTADPAYGRDGLHELRPSAATVDEPDDRTALSGGELVRYDVHRHRRYIDAPVTSLRERGEKCKVRRSVGRVHRDMDPVCTEGGRRELCTIEDEVRHVSEKSAVLPDRGLALRRVDDDDRPPFRVGHRLHLDEQREACATSSEHTRPLELADDAAGAQAGQWLAVDTSVLLPVGRLAVRRRSRGQSGGAECRNERRGDGHRGEQLRRCDGHSESPWVNEWAALRGAAWIESVVSIRTHATKATRTSADTAPAASSRAGRWWCIRVKRVVTKPSTAATHMTSSAATQGIPRSVPGAAPCTTAPTQATYADSWTTRHRRSRIGWRSALVTTITSMRSAPSTPSPRYTRRKLEANGTTLGTMSRCSSSTDAMMCAASRASAMSDTSR